MPNIKFGNIDFSGDGAYIWGAGEYSAPTRSVDFIEVPGRNGDLVVDNGNYNNTIAEFSVVITKNVKENTDRLKHLLYSQKGYQRLYDSDLKGFYRLACFSDGFKLRRNDGGEIDVKFDCKPFKYDILGDEDIVLEGNDVHYLENPYFEPSRPIVKVYGSGSGNLYINEKSIAISNIDEYVIIDTELQDAYKGDAENGLVNCNENVSTADFSLDVGTNEISYSGGISKAEIKPRWVTI